LSNLPRGPQGRPILLWRPAMPIRFVSTSDRGLEGLAAPNRGSLNKKAEHLRETSTYLGNSAIRAFAIPFRESSLLKEKDNENVDFDEAEIRAVITLQRLFRARRAAYRYFGPDIFYDSYGKRFSGSVRFLGTARKGKWIKISSTSTPHRLASLMTSTAVALELTLLALCTLHRVTSPLTAAVQRWLTLLALCTFAPRDFASHRRVTSPLRLLEAARAGAPRLGRRRE
jgi:hypothetical protein